MNGTASWFLLLAAGILLIIIGFEGALGLVVGVAFCPGSLAFYDSSGGFSTAPTTPAPTLTPQQKAAQAPQSQF